MRKNKKINLLYHLSGMFIIIYFGLLLRDVFFMIYIFFNNKIIYWEILDFKGALFATLYIYIPLSFVKICIYLHLKKEEGIPTKNMKYSLRKKK